MSHYLLDWKCMYLKRASKINSTFSSKGIVKISHAMNEQPIPTEYNIDLKILYPNFVLKEKQSKKRVVVEYML